MYSKCQRMSHSCVVPFLSLFAWVGTALPVLAQDATRSLPPTYSPDVPFTVSIEVDPPGGTFAYALEDSPPPGWTQIANVSDGGTYDIPNHKVKWVFFDAISRTLAYDVTPPGDATGEQCFEGTVSFDGADQPIEGDQCVIDDQPQPCCASDHTCANDVPAADCLDQGGAPQGVGATCGGTQACCLSDDSCVMADALCCVNELGGTPPGPGSTCGGMEACCDAAGVCYLADRTCCLANGDTPQGPGSACTQPEACCFNDGTCAMLDPFCCADQGGAPQGVGATCGGMEACCLPDNSCVMADALCCVNELGGTPQGPGTDCDPNPCAQEPIPTVSEWAIIAMTLLMLTAGTVILRRRRPAQG